MNLLKQGQYDQNLTNELIDEGGAYCIFAPLLIIKAYEDSKLDIEKKTTG